MRDTVAVAAAPAAQPARHHTHWHPFRFFASFPYGYFGTPNTIRVIKCTDQPAHGHHGDAGYGILNSSRVFIVKSAVQPSCAAGRNPVAHAHALPREWAQLWQGRRSDRQARLCNRPLHVPAFHLLAPFPTHARGLCGTVFTVPAAGPLDNPALHMHDCSGADAWRVARGGLL